MNQERKGFGIVSADRVLGVAETNAEGRCLLGVDYQWRIWKTKSGAAKALANILAKKTLLFEKLEVANVYNSETAE